ncbi:MAG: RluA family pseudouridine synthase [Candidatus Methylomirabilales bacterium]
MTDIRHCFTATPADAGTRLDAFLARVSGLSRARVQALIAEGRALVDGAPRKPRHLVTPGARVELSVPPPAPLALAPEAMPLDILYEDQDLLVLNKPAGLVVHPGAGRSSGTLVHGLLAHCPHLPGIGGVERPGIVHRLDRDTSGALVVAKSEAAHQSLARQFKARQVQKRYVALVHGTLRQEAGRIEAPIGRRAQERQKMGVREGGREARTAYRVLRRLPGRTLVECLLETGRTHQIRVHLAHLGHPVVGDRTYGGRRERRRPEAPRQMLHAWRLGFHHPASGAWLEFTAPIPADMQAEIGEPLSG